MVLKASFIGLGNMGLPMAHNLLKNGVELAVYNRTQEKSASLKDAGAQVLEHPKDAFAYSPIVFSMVANDQALADTSQSLLENAHHGCIHVSMSTVDPATTENLYLKHKEKGAELIAAPVFGRPDVAAKQALWICLAGSQEGKKQIEPYLHFIGKKIYDFGEHPEAANVVKIAGNFMILSVTEILGEAFEFLQRNEVNAEKFLDFITDSIFPSPVYQTYGKLILQQKFSPAGFKMSLGLKDLNLFFNNAKSLHMSTPFAEILKNQLLTSLKKGREDLDWSAISLLLKEV